MTRFYPSVEGRARQLATRLAQPLMAFGDCDGFRIGRPGRLFRRLWSFHRRRIVFSMLSGVGREITCLRLQLAESVSVGR